MNLTREQITEGNEKLAKLLGWYQDEPSINSVTKTLNGYPYDTWWENTEFAKYVAYSIPNNYPHKDLPFHRDWNYLMKVIDKIGSIVYHREGDAPEWNWKEHYSYMELFQDIFNKWLRGFDKGGLKFNLMNDIESVWIACVAWVDWHNNEKD